ncbi:MAG: hypothetical protein K2X03_18670 [Bryobacteraceae bacterium]|nr:hypothetical protein [Bryobacteraceae bacterium]
MPNLHQSATPILTAQIPALAPAFERMQGNILKSHGRDHAVNIFVHFTKPKASVKAFLKKYAPKLTTLAKQLKERQEFKESGLEGEIFRGVLLTGKGLSHLGASLAGFPAEFKNGMKSSVPRLNDPAVPLWDPGFRQEIHALFILADDDRHFLSREARALIGRLSTVGNVVQVETGHGRRNDNGDHIEHFGYVDGRSQPLFFEEEVASEQSNGGIDKWDPAAGPNLVLVKDPLHAHAESYGSFFVFRKLDQDVRGFKRAEENLGNAQLNADKEIAGAQVVGRFENGAPVTLAAAATMSPGGGTSLPAPVDDLPPTGVPNNFNYDADAAGQRCPFHAHIRKTNPRGSSPGGLDFDRTKRLARRGIPYGDRPEKEEPSIDLMPSGNVGLLFGCFVADIAQQFEFVQGTWVNNNSFPHSNDGIDPVIGQNPSSTPQPWSQRYGQMVPLATPIDFKGFVRMRGGEYFYAPSVPFFG